MTDDIRLIGDGEIHFVDIEASASTGRKPRISTNPAYSGGKLDVEWTHPETKERLPVVVDLETLEAGAGLPFVLYHRLDQPLGTIENIAKTQSDLKAEGSFTHGHTLYGANELTAARNGFKHRPSVTVYNPDPKNVIRVGEGERRFINGRTQEGAFFAVYHGKLRNISKIFVRVPIPVLLVPSTMRFTVERLLTMGTMDGSPRGKLTLHQNYPFKVSPFLRQDNGLRTIEGSNIKGDRSKE